MLERSGRPLGEVAGELADAFSLSAPEARGDVLRFVWQLNHLALVNVERTASTLGQLVDWLAARRATRTGRRRAGTGHAPTRDRHSHGRACAREHLQGGAAARGRGRGRRDDPRRPRRGDPRSRAHRAVLVGLATGLGLGLHEAAHAALLRGVPSALVVRGVRTRVLHAAVAPRRRTLVALGGPLAVAALGLASSSVGCSRRVPPQRSPGARSPRTHWR